MGRVVGSGIGTVALGTRYHIAKKKKKRHWFKSGNKKRELSGCERVGFAQTVLPLWTVKNMSPGPESSQIESHLPSPGISLRLGSYLH